MALSLAARRARLLSIRDLIDANGGGSVLAFGGVQPPFGGAPSAAPLLSASLGAVSFAMHETDAFMALETEGHVSTNGQPTWARFVDGAGIAVMDLPAGLPGSGMPVIITDGQDPPGNQMWVGGHVTITASIAEPEWA